MQRSIIFLLGCNLAGALPLLGPSSEPQQIFLPLGLPHARQQSTQHLVGVPRSAQLLCTASDDDEMVHVWLPLGQRIYTRDYPVLPLHPTSARIISVIGVSTEITARHKQQQVTCVMMAGTDSSQSKSVAREHSATQASKEVTVSFQEGDGVDRLDGAGSMWFLEEKEAESYECF